MWDQEDNCLINKLALAILPILPRPRLIFDICALNSNLTSLNQCVGDLEKESSGKVR